MCTQEYPTRATSLNIATDTNMSEIVFSKSFAAYPSAKTFEKNYKARLVATPAFRVSIRVVNRVVNCVINCVINNALFFLILQLL